MATRETRAQRGQRRGRMLVTRTLNELRDARIDGALSQRQVAAAVGWSQAAYARLETGRGVDLGILDVSRVASVLGYEVSLGLHPIGDPLRDKGQLACARRFDALLSQRWRATDETLLPGAGEQRAWDKLLRLVPSSPPCLVGVDIETRVADVQAITRRTRARERDGYVDSILVVLADTAHNRRIADELRQSLGDEYATAPRAILRALRRGEALPGSGVLLV